MAPKRSLPEGFLRRSPRLRKIRLGQTEPITIDLVTEDNTQAQTENESPTSFPSEQNEAFESGNQPEPVEETSLPDKGKSKMTDEDSDRDVLKKIKERYENFIHSQVFQSSGEGPSQNVTANEEREKETHDKGFNILEYLEKQNMRSSSPPPPTHGLNLLLTKMNTLLCQSQERIIDLVTEILEAERIEFSNLCSDLIKSFNASSSAKPNTSPKPDNSE